MALTKGKHNITEIEGIRCTLVESGITADRAEFLKSLLLFNGYEVKMEPEKAKDGSLLSTFVIGVTDLIFNPVIVVYQKKLYRNDGKVISPAYWNQLPDQLETPYWQVQR